MLSNDRELTNVPSFSDVPWELTQKDDDYMLATGGMGILEHYGIHIASSGPRECFLFMMEQFHRFGINPIPQNDLLDICWQVALHYVDIFDPYLFFDGVCDVVRTDESYSYQYSIYDEHNDEWHETDSEFIDTFKYWADGAANWRVLYDRPGLEYAFPSLYEYFLECWEEGYGLPIETDEELPHLYRKYGPQLKDLIHLGIWAAIMWMCSQEESAIDWRSQFHPIFNICYEEGSCIVLDGVHFAGPAYYKRVERRPGTCASCGIHEWCINLTTESKGEFVYKCEKCEVGERFPNRICGKRMCDVTTCQHHPLYGDTKAKEKMRKLKADKTFGTLRRLPNGMEVRPLPGYLIAEMKQIQDIGTGVGKRAGNEIYTSAIAALKKLKELT